MNRMRKIILTTIFFTLGLILCMSTKASAVTQSISLGGSINLSLGDMEASDNVYCVAHSKGFDGVCTFNAIAYVDIKGNHAQGITASGKELERKSPENAVIASILGGNLTRGYGITGTYNEAQRALYGFWNKWVGSVGGQYGFSSDSANYNIFAEQPSTQYLIDKARADSQSVDYEVRIYLLYSTSATNPQELILVEVKSTPPDVPPTPPDEPEPEPKQTEVTGYVNISGYVWEDIANSKNNEVNSKYDKNEQGESGGNDKRVEGIKVHWRAKDGSEIDSTVTDGNGSYKFSTTLALYNHPYEIKDKKKYDKINNSYIEFEYNGLKYTTVAYNGNLSSSDTSKGKESDNSRTALDNKFDRVENKAVYDDNKAIISDLPNTKISDANYTSELAVSASTKNIIRKLLKTTESIDGWTEKDTFCTDHCQVGEGPHVVYKETKGDSYIKIYCNGKVDIHDPYGQWSTDYKLSMEQKKKEIIGDAINTATGSESHYYSAKEIDGPTYRDCRKSEEKVYVWNIQNMNLGLVRREQPDAAITSDIEKVRVVMKNQEYTYVYGNRGIQNDSTLFDYKVKFGNKYLQDVYTRPVNPSDVAYVNYNNSDDLKVYVTYNLRVTNQSNTLQMKINNIVNYYDSKYTIYTGAGTSTSAGWQDTTETNNGYKVAYNTSLSGTLLQPGANSDTIKLEFEVSQEAIHGILNNNPTLNDFSEIVSFTTYYGTNTICAERESAETKGKVGKQYAGLDIDSTPGSAIPQNESTYEDDTDKAPSFLLVKDPNYKTMTGIVYEDTQTTESKNKNERLGNGQKEENEKGVENVRVELIEADTGELAYLYYKDASTETGANRKLAVTYTDANGNYSFGDAENCGVVVNNYIIKYTYGNADKGVDGDGTAIGKTTIDGGNSYINARNYKSTIITDTSVKEVMQGKDNDKWHLSMNESVDASIAVDDLEQRLSQETLKYSNYSNEENMSAYSKKFKVQIEYTQSQTAKVDNNGGDFQSDWSVFDFGIIERAREDVVVNKTISKIKLTLGNGQILFEGDPRSEKLNYVKAIGFSKDDIAKSSPLDRVLTIEMDQELIQGSRLEIWYSIILTNNSEKDYEYAEDSKYYYYGNSEGLNVMGLADLVVDYMNPSLVCDSGEDFKDTTDGLNNKDWFKVDKDVEINKDYLKDNGYISYKNESDTKDKTYEIIQNRELQCIATNTFANVLPGETKTSVVYASKVLANQEENPIYDNHVEIVALNGKTGRTIKSVNDDRTQISKEYQPGNYIPTLGSEHEQDDDRVRVIVTQPTGILNYTTIYIITAVVGLIVIAGGIVLIRKKFMNK